jgi:hypothetical protein
MVCKTVYWCGRIKTALVLTAAEGLYVKKKGLLNKIALKLV